MLGSVDDISSDVQFLLPWDWPWPLRMCCWVRACKPRAAGKDCHPFFGKVWASQPWKKTFRENKISWDLPSQFFGAEDGWKPLSGWPVPALAGMPLWTYQLSQGPRVIPASLVSKPQLMRTCSKAPSIATGLPRRNPKSMLSWRKDFAGRSTVGIRWPALKWKMLSCHNPSWMASWVSLVGPFAPQCLWAMWAHRICGSTINLTELEATRSHQQSIYECKF